MEDEYADTPPFWLQTSANPGRTRRGSSSLLPVVLLLLFLAAFIAFVFIVVPPFIRLSSQIFRPHSVKKSWDSLNLVLVLFAIVCGLLSRSNHGGDGGSSGSYPSSESRKSSSSNPATPHKWYDSYDRRTSERSEYGYSSSSFGRMRNSSSYPDLRAQDSPWAYGEGRRRFYDDTHLVAGRGVGSEPVYSRRRWKEEEEEDEEEKKYEIKRVVADDSRDRNAAVEKMEVPVRPPPPTPPPPPPPRVRASGNKRKPKRTYETVAHEPKDEVEKPPAPPPPPPKPVFHPMEEKSGKKRGGSATKEFLNSLKMKRKKQRQKSTENFESLLASQPLPSSSRLPPHPPPPPPPPSVFHTLFPSKKGKTRKALPAPPPPPPVPPSPAAQHKSRERPPAFSQSTANLIAINKSHAPMTTTLNYESSDDNINSGSLSPLIPIPPPPPPPPFKVLPLKFAVRGDYVRIKSTNVWHHGSPDTEDDEGDDEASVSGMTESPSNASSEATSPAFCPSPDVDTKADNFIARFRAGLNLEKANSLKQRRSNLAPERTG
ncbi:uncharacterized protein J3R85_015787 [Psidium guajava]|nr:uncharacterized protein J3R85_015787 [Psidium guajava]